MPDRNIASQSKITSPSKPISKREAAMTHLKNLSINCSFDEYKLYMILEHMRNHKLKEIYHKRGIIMLDEESESAHADLTHLIFPPRYHNLKKTLSIDGLVMRLISARRHPSIKASTQSWKGLDQMTLEFLQDLAATLRDRISSLMPLPLLRRPGVGFEVSSMASEIASFPSLPFRVVTDTEKRQTSSQKGCYE